MPHFRECWWDHVFCDILLSNIPAIMFGMWLLRKLGIREYDWLGRKGKESIWDWQVLHCHKKFGALMI
jgi:phosphatidylserine synthase 2